MPDKNTEISISFRGRTYRGLKDKGGTFIGLIGSVRPRGDQKAWHAAIEAAGAKLPPSSGATRTKRFDKMSAEELAKAGRPEEASAVAPVRRGGDSD